MKNLFQNIELWIPEVLGSIKRDLRNEHLAKLPNFYKAHFGNRPLNRLTHEEICAVYKKELLKGEDASLQEWVVNRWVFHHGDIYEYFSTQLEKIHPDFTAIQNLTAEQSLLIIEGAVARFGALNTYLFSVLNEVVFPESVLTELQEKIVPEANEAGPQDNWKERYEADMARLQKKCEEKVAGVLRKHAMDVEALKKQIRALQQQLSAR